MQPTTHTSSPTTASGSTLTSRRQAVTLASGAEQQEDFSQMVSEVSAAVGKYCSRRPRVVAGCIFSLGFIIGWKMRPW